MTTTTKHSYTDELIHHLFFPRLLPQEDQEESGLNRELLQIFTRELPLFLHQPSICEGAELSCLHELGSAFDKWHNIIDVASGQVTSTSLRLNIKQLQPGDTLPVYIREQNTAILIERLKDSFDVFLVQASAKSGDVVSTTGDLVALLPISGVSVPNRTIIESQAFADQLADLCNYPNQFSTEHTKKADEEFAEVREVARTQMVSDWLMAVLCVDGTVKTSFIQVMKKIRDEVLWKGCYKPFRRSGLYFCIKVILHFLSVTRLGENNGTIVYKAIMLQVLLSVFKKWSEERGDGSSETEASLSMQIMAKLAKRSDKLQRLIVTNQVSDWLQRQVQRVLATVLESVQERRVKLERDWLQVVESSRPPIEFNPEASGEGRKLSLSSPKSWSVSNPFKFNDKAQQKSRTRCRDKSKFPDLCFQQVDIDYFLIEIENWVRSQSITDQPKFTVDQYYNLFDKYISHAKKQYKNDPISMSRMILTAARILIEMERAVVSREQEFELVEKYAFVVETSHFNQLLLTTKDELEYLQIICQYISKRKLGKDARNILDEGLSPVDPTAFGVVFAKQNKQMQEERQKILDTDGLKAEEKLEEVKKKRIDYDNLKTTASKMSCSCVGVGATSRCQKCTLQEEAKSKHPTQYEKRLPADEESRNAVVFELCIPNELAMLRDAFHLYKRIVLCQKSDKLSKFRLWLNYFERRFLLDSSGSQEYKEYKSIIKNRLGHLPLVQLGSILKPVGASHYKESFLHFSADEKFIVEQNGMDVCRCFSEIGNKTDWFSCRYTYDDDGFDKLFVLPVSGMYSTLEWAIKGTRHTENEVLCKQDSCDQELNLKEFRAFGNLRAGHRLQLHNLLCAIEQRVLKFNNPSVLSLVQQTIYQTFPLSADWFPEAHEPFKNPDFVDAMTSALERLLAEVRDNWQLENTMLMIILLVSRLISVGEKPDRAITLLLECRKVCLDWQQKLEKLVSTTSTSELRKKLATIAAMTVLTFAVDSRNVFINSESLPIWLHSHARIQNNGDVPGEFRRRVRLLVIVCESHVVKEINQSTIKRFIDQYLPGSESGTISGLQRNDSEGLYSFNFMNAKEKETKMKISLDGQFFSSNFVADCLSSTILEHPEYKQLFGEARFVVRPSVNGDAMVTDPYRGYYYEFRTVHPMFSCEERRVGDVYDADLNGSKLLSRELFKGQLPELFCTGYSHWLDKRTNTVSFRPVSFFAPDFTNPSEEFSLDFNNDYLLQVRTKAKLPFRTTQRFREVFKVFKRIESEKYVHVFEQQDGRLTIELPRYGLNFEQKCSEVLSTEFRGMRVAKVQRIDTLIGLEHGLVLEPGPTECEYRQKILLLPHAPLKISVDDSNSSQGRRIEIEWDNLANPLAHFEYTIDTRLQQLRPPPSHAAVLYLAYLHAVTSYVLPDPFTGLTGSERAVEILQSGACFSCQPLDKESEETLKWIEKLSPERSYYPGYLKSMQSINWPDGIDATQALDAYKILANQLRSESQRSAFAFALSPAATASESKDDSIHDLYWRALWRSEQQRSLLTDETMALRRKPEPKQLYNSVYCFERRELAAVRKLVAYAMKTHGKTVRPPDLDVNLLHFFQRSSEQTRVKPFDDHGLLVSAMPPVEFDRSSDTYQAQFLIVFQQEWRSLAEYGLRCKSTDADMLYRLVFHLSIFAYMQVPLENLLPLLCIAISQTDLADVRLPNVEHHIDIAETEYSAVAVLKTINDPSNSLNWPSKPKQQNESPATYDARVKVEWSQFIKLEAEMIEQTCLRVWRDGATPVTKFTLSDTCHVKPEVVGTISSLFEFWRCNAEWLRFLVKLASTLTNRPVCEAVKLTNCSWQPPSLSSPSRHCIATNFSDLPENLSKCTNFIDVKSYRDLLPSAFDRCVQLADEERRKSAVQLAMQEDLKQSLREYVGCRQHPLPVDKTLGKDLLDIQTKLKSKSDQVWQSIVETLSPNGPAHQALKAAGLWPRIVPSQVLPCIVSRLNRLRLSEKVRGMITEYMMLVVYEQFVDRCLSYVGGDESAQKLLERELNNRPHSNWKPAERPEWLLFELENDLTIRPVQVTVAERMISPESNENSTMQLNMGEGKTMVIVPIVLLALADGSRLARLTVLKALLRMNFNSLKRKLGGLLDRRMYLLPSSRAIQLDEARLGTIQQLLNECKMRCGVWVTLAEYRNSFKLQCVEACHNYKNFKRDVESHKLAKQSMEVLKWLRQNARDVLDESDEILHVKFQLIYTLGDKRTVDGKAMRWKVATSILKLAAKHLGQMANDKQQYSNDIEYVKTKPKYAFPSIRLLSDRVSSVLNDRIVEDILSGNSIIINQVGGDGKAVIKKFILEESASGGDKDQVKRLLGDDSVLKTLLLVRGILSFGVLSHVLTKRWRVNYGVNPRLASATDVAKRRAMAVPFHFKDVPSDRAEFGHADVAIMFTILSYYYSGLDDKQLDDVFKLVDQRKEGEQRYCAWMHEVNADDVSIREYVGVNLEDREQKQRVYGPLRRHPLVIDFYLDAFVFHREAKTYQQKIVTSAWDLAEKTPHPTTGFSGTNETKLLLPSSISQKDLPELQHTNGMMVTRLLHVDNNECKALAHATGSEILELLVSVKDKRIRVLLDVGGLILDMDNRRVAERWLKRARESDESDDVTAAVYFDDENELQVVDMHGKTVRFDLSPYAKALDRCVVYLDDMHTRGTDLRFPVGSRAAVTLGKGVTKDRLVQACMRMRLLGQDHSVLFLAAHDVYKTITSNRSDYTPGSVDVLQWALRNSCEQVENGFVYWSTMGASYYHRVSAFAAFDNDGDCVQLIDNYREAEASEIEEVYPLGRREIPLPELADRYFHTLRTETVPGVADVRSAVIARCKQYAATVSILCAAFAEEQERELEAEILPEQQAEIQRPGPRKPARPSIHDDLCEFVKTGCFPDKSSSVVGFSEAFKRTSLEKKWAKELKLAWQPSFLVTCDFVNVCDDTEDDRVLDEYLRLPRWVMIGHCGQPVVFVSAFEANELLNQVRTFNKVSLSPFTEIIRKGQHQVFGMNGVSFGRRILKNPIETAIVLHSFCGSAYFSGKAELDFWCSLRSIEPSDKEQRLSNEFRRQLESKQYEKLCPFHQNLPAFARELIELRNFHAVHELADVMVLLNDCKRLC